MWLNTCRLPQTNSVLQIFLKSSLAIQPVYVLIYLTLVRRASPAQLRASSAGLGVRAPLGGRGRPRELPQGLDTLGSIFFGWFHLGSALFHPFLWPTPEKAPRFFAWFSVFLPSLGFLGFCSKTIYPDMPSAPCPVTWQACRGLPITETWSDVGHFAFRAGEGCFAALARGPDWTGGWRRGGVGGVGGGKGMGGLVFGGGMGFLLPFHPCCWGGVRSFCRPFQEDTPNKLAAAFHKDLQVGGERAQANTAFRSLRQCS